MGKIKYKPILVGIDPGTTSSYAVLDLDGKLIKATSGKDLDLSRIIMEVTSVGTPIVVGTDKKNVPQIISKFAARTGARIIKPIEDISVKEKMSIVNFETRNEHERDSIASAEFARKEIEPLISKIKKGAKENNVDPSLIAKLVIVKGISVSAAIERISLNEIIMTAIEVPKQEPRQQTDKNIERIKILEKETNYLRQNNAKLIRALNKQKSKIRKISSRPEQKTQKEAIMEKSIIQLLTRLSEKEKQLERAKEMELEANSLISHSKGKVIAKKLANLSWDEYAGKRSQLNPKEGDVLLVKNPNVFSKRTLDELSEKIHIILYDEPIDRKIAEKMGFVFINAEGIQRKENRLFALIEGKELEAQRGKINLLNQIIDSYRKERIGE